MSQKIKAVTVPEHLSHIVNLQRRVIILPSTVTTKLFQQVDMAMTYLEEISDEAPITFHICNSGGDVETALGIVGRMDKSPCLTIGSAYGKVMSAAIYILAGCDEREAHSLCNFMWHEQSLGLAQSTMGGIKHEIESTFKSYNQLCKWMERRTGYPESFWFKKGGNGRDYFFTAEEAIKIGLCHRSF